METITSAGQQMQWAIAFAAVAEHGSFTAAASALACSKALVSKQVAQLEILLGTQLLFRSTRKLSLTESGRLYLEHCRHWQAGLVAARQAVAELGQEIAGTVRLTVPTSFGGVFMADALIALRERHPGLQIELDLSREARDLEADGFDAAIRSHLPPPERLVAKPLAMAQDWLVAAPTLVERLGPPQHPANLAAWPCLANSFFRQDLPWPLSRGGTLHSVGGPVTLRANDYQLLRNLALSGAGALRIPAYLVSPDVAAGRLLRLLPDYALPAQPLYLIYPQRLPQPAKVRALVDFLVNWFNQPQQAALLGHAIYKEH
ncbi:MAG TPA: LysR substrate-binding domain-containing protein [Chitinolyticbacter sp.]|nr:LysR substrate-binding domain-containing protein [Chitinolyticbacter sp.]